VSAPVFIDAWLVSQCCEARSKKESSPCNSLLGLLAFDRMFTHASFVIVVLYSIALVYLSKPSFFFSGPYAPFATQQNRSSKQQCHCLAVAYNNKQRLAHAKYHALYMSEEPSDRSPARSTYMQIEMPRQTSNYIRYFSFLLSGRYRD
jgi:hypothetical protein